MRKRLGERVLGPYEQVDSTGRLWWRIIAIAANGDRKVTLHQSEREAELYRQDLEADITSNDHTTKTALAEYKKHLQAKGNKADSIRQTLWVIGLFFPEPVRLDVLTPKRAQRAYDEMRERPTSSGDPPSGDTHRGGLAQVKTFCAWLIKQGWLRGENPFAGVEGVGRRRPRGKSLGKHGLEWRTRESRAWYAKALELADNDDEGAIAALTTLLLGLRASEVVSRKVRDLDDDEAPGDLLWIADTKTEAGRRELVVPDVLRPYLLACADGKTPDRYLFECQREQDPIGKRHDRDWVRDQVHRICDLAKVPRVTAHALRGLLATLSRERGLAGHLVAATLGHESTRMHETAYAKPGAAQAGDRRRGLRVLEGGVSVRKKEG